MSTPGSRPNFFAILDLDPDAPWDQAAFHRALDDKRAQWSRQRTGVKTNPVTVEARRNLALVRDLEGVMLDPEAREGERAAALKQRQDEMLRRRDDFAGRLDLMLAKGFLYDVEYEALRAREDVLSQNPELRQQLEAAQKRPFQQARKDNERLDQSAERNLRANLAILGEPDLYAVLRSVDDDIGMTTPRERLRAAADELYRKARNTANKNRPEVGAMQELAGIAKKIFSSDELVRRHNFSMLLAPLDAILDRYEQALVPVRAVDSRQFERFLREAATAGVDVALAKEAFTGYFRERNWSVDAPHESAEVWLQDQLPCPRCSELNDPAAGFCSKCGNPLKAACPRCAERITVSARACPHCGFPVGQRDWARYLAEEAEAYLARSDLGNAADFLRRAEAAWPAHNDPGDQLAAQLREAEEKLDAMQAELQKTIDRATAQMDGRSYHAARRLLRPLALQPTASALLTQCEAAVSEADRKCQQASRPGTPMERKAVLYLEALDHCADHSEARRQLGRIPPGPPRRLRVSADDERRVVRLRWDKAPDHRCFSVVFRADGPVPPTSAAGQRRHEVRSGSGAWEDPDPLIGLPMSYAVYTEREQVGTLSEQATETTEPVLITAEVQHLEARPGDREVVLTWVLPDNATGVEVERAEVAPGATSFMLEVPDVRPTRKVDKNVRNGVRYRYTVRAKFRYPEPDGHYSERRSLGLGCEVTPTPPPVLPGPAAVRGYAPPPHMGMYHLKVELQWPQPQRGVVKVIRSVPEVAPLRRGDEFPEEELPRHGLVLGPQEPDVWFQDNVRLCCYTSVLILDGRCYVGESRRYASGPEVGDLRAEYAGTAVHVTWSWPDGIDRALIAWDERELSDSATARLREMVDQAGNDRVGTYEIPVRSAQQLFVVVAVVVPHGGADFISSGVGTAARQQAVSLRYDVRRRSGRRAELVLRPERPARLPALLLFGRSDAIPAGRDDYRLMRIPPGRVGRELGIPLQMERSIDVTSCRLFVENEAEGVAVRIIDPV